DAHRDEPVALLPAPQLVQHGPHQAGSRHPVGMADRYRAAVRIETVGIEAEPVAAVERLRGEGLVELDDVDVVEIQTHLLEQLGHREHGPDAYLVGLACRLREPASDAYR